MASQRITIAKIGGAAADVALLRMRQWSAARQTIDASEWSSGQWPADVRAAADAFAHRLRDHAMSLPVIYFVEWSDLWSMGDMFNRSLTPQDGQSPLAIHGDRFEVYGYELPDGGRLDRHLSSASPLQFAEYDYFVSRLRDGVAAWQPLVERAVIIVLREVVGGLLTDEELKASLAVAPSWIM